MIIFAKSGCPVFGQSDVNSGMFVRECLEHLRRVVCGIFCALVAEQRAAGKFVVVSTHRGFRVENFSKNTDFVAYVQMNCVKLA